MPRYVILYHETPPGAPRAAHWDFMLEAGGVLRTWALAAEPCPDVDILAEELADHRLAYLDYEGPVSGDRGHVTRWDSGEYLALTAADGQELYEICGGRLAGIVDFARASRLGDGGQRWIFRFKNK